MLSVIIPTRNRAHQLGLALASLQTQRLPAEEFEVLVIDNGSTDETREIVESFQKRCTNMRYFFDPKPGLHVGRHRGLIEARGDVLVYADDDIEATPTWLDAIHECFRVPEVVLVGGNNYPKFETPPPSWLQKLWEQPGYGGHAITSLSVLQLSPGRRAVSPFFVWGCNFSIRKSVLLEARGFHPDGMPDEHIRFRGDGETHVSAHVQRRGLRCMFDSRASVHHAVTRERMTFDYFRKRSFNQGISDSYTQLRNSPGQRVSWPRRQVASAKEAVRRVQQQLKRLFPSDRELRELRRIMHEAYQNGYKYHQDVYRDDPEVRDWVHRPDYF